MCREFNFKALWRLILIRISIELQLIYLFFPMFENVFRKSGLEVKEFHHDDLKII